MKYLTLIFLLVVMLQVEATSIAMPPTDTGTVRRANGVVEGYFDNSSRTVMREYQSSDATGKDILVRQVHTLRNFHITNVLAGENYSVGSAIELDYLGGSLEGITTPNSITPTAASEPVIIALEKTRYGAPNNSIYHVSNQKIFKNETGESLESRTAWVKKIRSASIEEYNQMIEKEWAEKGMNQHKPKEPNNNNAKNKSEWIPPAGSSSDDLPQAYVLDDETTENHPEAQQKNSALNSLANEKNNEASNPVTNQPVENNSVQNIFNANTTSNDDGGNKNAFLIFIIMNAVFVVAFMFAWIKLREKE